jgi:DNA-directed RNA polymerase specialized sigma24 family protein
MVSVVGEQPPWKNLVLWAIRGYAKRTDFEDIFQEAMLASWKSARKSAAGTLGCCTLNQAVVKSAQWAASDYTRCRLGGARCREVPTLSLDLLMEQDVENDKGWEPACDDIAPAVIERVWLSVPLQRLTPDQREVLRRKAEGESEDDIAAALGLKKNRVRHLGEVGRKALRARLTAEGE